MQRDRHQQVGPPAKLNDEPRHLTSAPLGARKLPVVLQMMDRLPHGAIEYVCAATRRQGRTPAGASLAGSAIVPNASTALANAIETDSPNVLVADRTHPVATDAAPRADRRQRGTHHGVNDIRCEP